MSVGMILASPKPFPESIYLTDMDVDDGKPFKSRPAVDLCACPIETGYCPKIACMNMKYYRIFQKFFQNTSILVEPILVITMMKNVIISDMR